MHYPMIDSSNRYATLLSHFYDLSSLSHDVWHYCWLLWQRTC